MGPSWTGRLLLGLALAALAGCVRVQPYERGELAQRAMRMPPSAVDAGLDEHIYFSKEGSRGGAGAGGGGCGCN
jgi:hypothetical protein